MTDKKILIVADGSSVATEIQSRLRNLGYGITGMVLRGEDALSAVEKNMPDLVLMDAELTGEMDGIEAANQILLRFDIPTVFLVTVADEGTGRKAKRAGPYGFGYVLKPFEETDLRVKIEIALYKRELEKRLFESEERYRDLFENASALVRELPGEQPLVFLSEWQKTVDSIEDMIMVLDRDFRILRMNRATVSFLGLPKEKIIGRYCHQLMHGTDCPLLHCPGEKMLISKMHEETDLYDEKRGLWFHVTVDPLSDEKGDLAGIAHTVRDITHRKRTEEALKGAHAEIEELKDRLEAENICLKQEIEMEQDGHDIVGNSAAFKNVLRRMHQFASTDTTVLILGETGTGKGVIARAIHSLSNRNDKHMIHVNCSALPANLIENELFGRERGAFTGALEKQIGRFELAHQGTIFLDEVGELPMELQSKLLRVLEDGTFERLGNPHTVKVDVRVIASTNRDIEKDVRNGRFRQDLYFRLNILPITIPPLRQRKDDIPLLVKFFIAKFNRKYNKHITSIPPDVLRSLETYSWPGNVRELANVIERSVITSRNSALHMAEKMETHLPFEREATNRSLEDIERSHILKILQDAGWKVEGPRGAAQTLGLNPSTLRARMKKLGIRRPIPR